MDSLPCRIEKSKSCPGFVGECMVSFGYLPGAWNLIDYYDEMKEPCHQPVLHGECKSINDRGFNNMNKKQIILNSCWSRGVYTQLSSPFGTCLAAWLIAKQKYARGVEVWHVSHLDLIHSNDFIYRCLMKYFWSCQQSVCHFYHTAKIEYFD